MPWRRTSELVGSERAFVDAFLAARPWFDLYHRCALDDLARGLDNRSYLVDGDAGLIMAIHFERVSIFSTLGELSDGALAALLAHPGEAEVHAEAAHGARLLERADCQRRLRRTDTLRYYRRDVPDARAAPLPAEPGCRRLGPADFERVAAFFAAHYPETVFSPWMLDRPFVGLFDEGSGELVAAAGTLIVNDALGQCHVGNFLTHPDRRGEGLGARAARGLMHELQVERAMTTFMLGVFDRNEPACRLYERVGFEQVGFAHLVYLDALNPAPTDDPPASDAAR